MIHDNHPAFDTELRLSSSEVIAGGIKDLSVDPSVLGINGIKSAAGEFTPPSHYSPSEVRDIYQKGRGGQLTLAPDGAMWNAIRSHTPDNILHPPTHL